MRNLVCFWCVLAWGCGDDDRPPGTVRDGGDLVDATTDARSLPDVMFPDVPGEVCESVSAVAEPLPPTLVFQLDMSSSMNCAVTSTSCASVGPTPDPNDSRWDVFRQVFLASLDSLPNGTRLGVMRFPRSEGACANDALEVSIENLESNRGAVESTISALVPNGVGTPTHDAVLYGLGQLHMHAHPRP